MGNDVRKTSVAFVSIAVKPAWRSLTARGPEATLSIGGKMSEQRLERMCRIVFFLGLWCAVVLSTASAFAAPPSNDDCSGAIVIPATAGSSGPYTTAPVDVTNATPQGVDEGLSSACLALNGGTPIDRTIWYAFTPAVSGNYAFNTCYMATGNASTLLDSVITILNGSSGCPAPSASLTCDDSNGCSCGPQTSTCGGPPGAPFEDQAQAVADLVAGNPYYIVAGNYVGDLVPGFGQLAISVSYRVPPSNDTCASPTPLALDRITLRPTEAAHND